MKLRSLAISLILFGAMAAQDTKQPPQLKPQDKQAPGAGPDKVWVNAKSNVYHCPGDRFYGRTKDGKYMTEKDAKAAGAHGERGQSCFK
jgi:hypothetical protein